MIFMKKKIFLTLLLGFFIFLGCSSNGDDSTTDADNNPSGDVGNGNSDDDDDDVVVDRSGNLLPTGASASDLLSNTNFDRLIVEIGHVAGFQPTTETIANFEEFIRNRTFKQEIEVRLNSLDSPNEETLTIREIADLESENRTVYNDGTTLAVYIYFADAPSDSDDPDESLVTVGAVFQNTSMVIYESTIRDLERRSNTVSLTDLETATLNHEFGHLFGLVNLGTEAQNDHEDPNAPNHCVVEGCLMRAEIQFGAVSRNALMASKMGGLHSACNLNGNTLVNMLESRTAMGMVMIPVLDDECILDLQNNGGR